MAQDEISLEELYPEGRHLYLEEDDVKAGIERLEKLGIIQDGFCVPFFCPVDRLQALYDSGIRFGS